MAIKKSTHKTPTKKEIEDAAASVEKAIERLEVEEIEVQTESTVIESTVPDEEKEVVKEESIKEEEKQVEEKKDEKEAASDSVFTRTTFEREADQKGNKMSKIIIVLCLCIIFTILGFTGGYFYAKGYLGGITGASNAPESMDTIPTFTPTPTVEEVDLSAYSIEILNGSGVAGVAGTEQDALETDGFSVENTGNAATQDFSETAVAVKSSVPEEFIEKLKTSLSERYVVDSTVEELEDDAEYDIVITIGSETVVDE